ncbi:MAG: replication initiation protein [Nitrospirae bacterium]|nr:replication initiation protein [Nitrospirota bacterium]MBF0535799.1 replication initiation protein [Nitrospirota bacterium]MBF0617660.1 replication initiation protein [Nitrospirota bacterium]
MSESYDKNLITKSNRLVEARYKLTVNEQKLILWLISKIEPDDEDFKIYTLKITEFMDMLGIEHKGTYAEVQEITYRLMEKVLQIKEPAGLLQIAWFSSAQYFDGKGYVELEFSPKLKPYLLGLKERFLSYRLQNVIQLKSSYSIRIYELLKQYEKIGTRIFKISEFKKMLGLGNEYPLYSHFKERVITVAQKELKVQTDISFEFREIKLARKVTEIEFLIIKNEKVIRNGKQVSADPIEKTIFKLEYYEKNLFDKLQKYYQLSREQAHDVVIRILPQMDKEYIEGLLNYCSGYYEKKKKENINVHLGAITWKALQEGWQPQQSLFDIESKEKEHAELKRQAETKRKEKEKHDKEIRIKEQIYEAIENLTPEDKSEIEEEFPKWLKINNPYNYNNKYQPDMSYDIIKTRIKIDLYHFMREKLIHE